MVKTIVGQTLVDPEGDNIGQITDIINNPTTLEPEMLVVRTSRLRGEHLVPVRAVRAGETGATAPFTKAQVKDGPSAKDHTAPTSDERRAIYEHYGIDVPPSGKDA